MLSPRKPAVVGPGPKLAPNPPRERRKVGGKGEEKEGKKGKGKKGKGGKRDRGGHRNSSACPVLVLATLGQVLHTLDLTDVQLLRRDHSDHAHLADRTLRAREVMLHSRVQI